MAFNVISIIDLDMARPTGATINAVQYDSSGRVVRINFYNNGVVWTVPSNVYPVIRYIKSDRMGGFYDIDENGASAISYKNNRATVDITLALQVLTTPGNVNVQINFYDASGNRVTAFAFKVVVQASVVPDDKIVSSDYYNALSATLARVVKTGGIDAAVTKAEAAVTKAEAAVTKAEAAANRAEAAASSVISDVPPIVTDWLSANISNPSNPPLDRSLSIMAAAAPADLAGDQKNVMKTYVDSFSSKNVSAHFDVQQGSISSSGSEVASTSRIRTTFIPISEYNYIKLINTSGYTYDICYYDANKNFLLNTGWINASFNISIPENHNAAYIRIVLAYSNSGNILPSAFSAGMKIVIITNNHLENAFETYLNALSADGNETLQIDAQQGSISSTGIETSASNRIRSMFIPIMFYSSLSLILTSGYKHDICYYDRDKKLISNSTWSTNRSTEIKNPLTNGASYIRIILATTNDSNLGAGSFSTGIRVVAKTKSLPRYKTLTHYDHDLNDTSKWEYGSITLNVSESTVNTRIKTKDFYKVHKGDLVYSIFEDSMIGMKYILDICLYDDTLTGVLDTYWLYHTPYEVPYDCYIRIVASKRDNSEITEQEFEDIVQNVFINKYVANLDTKTENGFSIKSITHRGYNYYVPENTLPAYYAAYEHGFDYVETDVNFTSDGVCICLHDNTINRTARNPDGSQITEEIDITSITYEQALQYDFGIYQGEQFAGTKIPTFAEFLDFCKSLNLNVYVDFKTTPPLSRAQVEEVVDIVIEHGMQTKTTYITGVLSYGTWITQKEKTARVGSIKTLIDQFCAYTRTFLTGYNGAFMDPPYAAVIDNDNYKNALKYGLPVEVWVVNSESQLDALPTYVSGVTTDYLHAAKYFEKKEKQVIQPEIVLARATNLTGGYSVKNNVVTVDIDCVSNWTASNSPQLFGGLPTSDNDFNLMNCIVYTTVDNVLKTIAANIDSRGRLYVAESTSGDKLHISGSYSI